MGNLATEDARILASRAKAGDVKAGGELIKLCRSGMVVPYWEDEPMIDAEAVERHLARRVIVGSGKGTM
jgi:hypothetical protein